MNMKETIRAGLLAILFLAPSTAATHAQSSVAKITEAQATKIALERIPGKVTDVKIERKRGKNVYVVEIQTPDRVRRTSLSTSSPERSSERTDMEQYQRPDPRFSSLGFSSPDWRNRGSRTPPPSVREAATECDPYAVLY